MKGKILLVTGFAIGYVLGTRAGRERYEDIKAAANKFWNDPRVQKQVHTAEDFAKEKGTQAAEYAADGAKKAVSRVTGRGSSSKNAAPKKTGTTATTPSSAE